MNKRNMIIARAAFLGLGLALALSAAGSALQGNATIETEIRAVLDAQKAAWNAKSVDGFMEYYWKSEEMTFLSGQKVLHGWDTLRNRYNKNYPVDKMGVLDFSDLEIRPLDENIAYVLGRWAVSLDGKTQGGVFTLIFRHTSKGWRIVH
ncbi:MAG: DUF4440 domain-containing protein, partial [Candidatus Aminicenantes bacterium]|nr:DUF4440 domain-containing protein [Candidatus Aminicenantes bacterium]